MGCRSLFSKKKHFKWLFYQPKFLIRELVKKFAGHIKAKKIKDKPVEMSTRPASLALFSLTFVNVGFRRTAL